MCCTRLAGNAGPKNRQKFAIWGPSHKFVGPYLRKWCMYRQSEKKFKQQCLLHMFSHYGELRPTSGWDRFVSLGHPSKFQRVSRFGFVTAATSLNGSQPNFARCLAISWAGTLYIHFRGFLPRNGILPCATFALRPSLALFGSVTARHSSSVRQPNFAAMNRGRHLYSAWRPSRWSLAHILVQWSVCLLHLFILSTFTASVENLKLSLFVIWVWQTTTNVWNYMLLVASKL